ncbi:hypothetical protein BN871_HV_00030 [Paenibacillus sp. P22]|nr:hypothetical protein BN871_HV_00030 [Paenibacillus sp. P22]
MQQGEDDAADDRHEEAEPRRAAAEAPFAGEIREHGRAERADDHEAFKADVDDAGALREDAAERGQNQGGREDQRGVDQLSQKIHLRRPLLFFPPFFEERLEEPFDDAVAGYEEDDRADDDPDDFVRNLKLEVHALRAVAEEAEQNRAEHDAERVVAAEQRHGDSVESVARLRVHDRHGLEHAENLEGAAETGEGAGDHHRLDDAALDVDARVESGIRVVAAGAQLVPLAGLPKNVVENAGAKQGDDRAPVDAGIVHQSGQPVDGCRCRRQHILGAVLPFLDHDDANHEVGEVISDPVQHDRRNDFVDSATRFEPAGKARPDRARKAACQNGQRKMDEPRQIGVDADPCSGRHPHDELAFRTDVEQSSAERERNRQAGEDQRRDLADSFAEVVGSPENFDQHGLIGFERVESAHPHDDGADDQAENDGQNRNIGGLFREYLIETLHPLSSCLSLYGRRRLPWRCPPS